MNYPLYYTRFGYTHAASARLIINHFKKYNIQPTTNLCALKCDKIINKFHIKYIYDSQDVKEMAILNFKNVFDNWSRLHSENIEYKINRRGIIIDKVVNILNKKLKF